MNLNETILWTAVITPLDREGRVDVHSLETLLHQQESARNGILVLGSTGEALNLDAAERNQILDFTQSLGLRVPIMVGVGGIHMEDTLAWVRSLESRPVHAYLLVTPLYAKPGRHGQTAWFQQLLDASTRPCMIYNIPSRTGKALEHETVKDLQSHPRFWAIKEASGSEQEFSKYRAEAPRALLMSGDDALTPAFGRLGANGLVSVASNVWPEAAQRITRLSIEKKLSAEDETMWKECSNALFLASNPVPVKRLMAELGIIATAETRLPLSARDLESAERLLEAHRRVTAWYERNRG